VSERSAHLSALRLEQLAEGTLAAGELEHARAHVESCARCAAELESYRSLFAMLGELPRFAPSPAFADGVMARVTIAPKESTVLAWLRRLAPATLRGWALLGAVVTTPVIPLLALLAWVLGHPLVSPVTLWQWGTLRTQSLTQATLAWLVEGVAGVGYAEVLEMATSALQGVPGSALGGAIAVLALGIPLSAWSLVRLTRTPSAGVTYAN
jgi:hypothetical protein